jgi:2-oxoglutarate dehydrogenase E1 component
VRRLILASGKICVELASSRERSERSAVAVCRVEQLYPFPEDDVRAVLEGYPRLEEVIWMQEEPRNMGAWEHLAPQIAQLVGGRWPLRYLGRPASSSPAEGSAARHNANQAMLIHQACDQAETADEESVLLKKT